jgi:hypothetical protein
MKRALFLSGLVILMGSALTACSPRPSGTMETVLRNSTYDIRLETPATIVTGIPATLTLHILRDGEPTNVILDHRSLHAVLQSEDLEDLRHTVNFRYREDGAVELDQIFARPGRYRLWIEVDNDALENPHGPNAELVATQEFTVTGDSLPVPTSATTGTSVTGSGFTLTMSHGPLVVGKPVPIRFVITDASGEAVTLPPRDPILFGLVDADRSFFLHGHLFTDPGWKAAGDVFFFPHPGRYDLVAQAFWVGGTEFRLLEGHFILPIQ